MNMTGIKEPPLELHLLRESTLPLYRQIAEAILGQVRTGRLATGVKLPSTRTLAKQLGVHRRTVIAAFRRLEEDGWVVSGVGQGTFISEKATASWRSRSNASSAYAATSEEISVDAPRESASFSWESVLRESEAMPEFWRYWTRERGEPGTIRFTGATADPSLFPTEDFHTMIDEVFRQHGANALDYGPAEGYGPLREWVADRMRARGVPVEVDQVLIVSGSQQGLDLLTRLLVRAGDTVAVEEPGYANGFRLFQACGAQVAGVPTDEGGLRCDLLEAIVRRARPRFLYLMPLFQNPTGLSLREDRIEPLLELCGRNHLPLIEDQFDADLHYEGEPPRPLKARDGREMVVLLGSFSKILFPGLRLGWIIVPPALLAPLRELKQTSDFSSGLLVQCAMEAYCRRGLLDRHLERVRAIYGRRLRVMLEAMDAEFPSDAQWTRPRGGLTLWVTLPPGLEALDLWPQARREGVDFSPGPFFYPNGGGGNRLRLSYIRETEDRIRRGIGILGALMKTARTRGSAAPASGPFV